MIKWVFTLLFVLFFSFSLSAQAKVKFGLYGGVGYGIANTVNKTFSPTNSYLSPSESVSWGIGRSLAHYADFEIDYDYKFKSNGAFHIGVDFQFALKNNIKFITGLEFLFSQVEMEANHQISFDDSSLKQEEIQLGWWNIPETDFLLISENSKSLYKNQTFGNGYFEVPLKLQFDSPIEIVTFEVGTYLRYLALNDGYFTAQQDKHVEEYLEILTNYDNGSYINLPFNKWGYGLQSAIAYNLTKKLSLRLQLKCPVRVKTSSIEDFVLNPDHSLALFSQLDLKYTFGKDH